MVSIPGLSRKSEEKGAPRKTLVEQMESADVDELIVKTENEIGEANDAIARIEARIAKLQGRLKYLKNVKELQPPKEEESTA